MNLRWGILGCARISRRGLIPGIKASKTGRLVALASRNPATARAWCDEFKILKSHETYQGLLEDPEIDAVYIPLPNELHKPWVVAAAEAGKRVLCEKPLALNAVEAREMVEQCRSRGVLLMEAFMWRHQPRTLELRACCRRLARRPTLDPVVILVSHRARRLAIGPGARGRRALGRRMLRNQHGPVLRGR